jgi:hypothetical protein
MKMTLTITDKMEASLEDTCRRLGVKNPQEMIRIATGYWLDWDRRQVQQLMAALKDPTLVQKAYEASRDSFRKFCSILNSHYADGTIIEDEPTPRTTP